MNRGFILAEVFVSISMLFMITFVTFHLFMKSFHRDYAAHLGHHLDVIGEAVNRYITQYHDALISGSPIAISDTTFVINAYSPTIQELEKLGFLSGYQDKWNGWTQNGWFTRLSLVPSGCSEDRCHIAGLVWLGSPLIKKGSKQKIDWEALIMAVRATRGDGLYSDTFSPGWLKTLSGIKKLPNPLGNFPGVLAIEIGDFVENNHSFLRRDGSLPMTGHLFLGNHYLKDISGIEAKENLYVNTPHTILLDGKGILTADQVQFSTRHHRHDKCLVDHALTLDPIGKLLVCHSGRWLSLYPHLVGRRALFHAYAGLTIYGRCSTSSEVVMAKVTEDGLPWMMLFDQGDWVQTTDIESISKKKYHLTLSGLFCNTDGNHPIAIWPM